MDFRKDELLMENKIKVFCYGSNMSSKRLKLRCPNAQYVCVAILSGYKFTFNKKSNLRVGSGKGNIISTQHKNDLVYGIVFEVPKSEENALDEAEGWKEDDSGGYNKETIYVNCNDELIEVFVYIATKQEFIEDGEKPFDWYKNHCVKGAEEFKLPDSYIEYLKSFTTKTDTNKMRIHDETSIYE